MKAYSRFREDVNVTIHEEIARRCITRYWRDDFVYGVLETALKRPGRGRSGHGSNDRGWRYDDRPRELARFSAFMGELIRDLETGALDAESARLRIDESSYAAFPRIATSMDEMIACLADNLRAGDNVWSEGWSPPGLSGNRVFTLRSWYDRCHPRIV